MNYELGSGWKLKYADLNYGIEKISEILASSDGWMDVSLPCDIHVPLIANGIINDPVIADHCFDSEWIEDKSWWFVNEFDLDIDLRQPGNIELVCEGLDGDADIFLNGTYIGHHQNAFRPFVVHAEQLLKRHGNILVIRLTTGIEKYSDKDLVGIGHCVNTEDVRNRPERGDRRRALLRKPQYCFGWDWCPRIVTCGIMAPIHFLISKSSVVRRLHCTTVAVEMNADLLFEAEVESFKPLSTSEVELSLHLYYAGEEVSSSIGTTLLRSGLNYLKIPLTVVHPKLWWPNGLGDHPLYDAKLIIKSGGIVDDEHQISFGIRTIVLDMKKDCLDGFNFGFCVNGVNLFCKGANWIPADSIYGRVTDEKYTKLIEEAAECNFNMLRVWGGGIYEREIFYNLCDAQGLLVWQDFMFACAVYPDSYEWFRNEVELEIDYQTKRLATHPCMALWCGNNENTQCFDELWIGDHSPKYLGGVICYNHIAPAILHKNCPEIPYWNSSPYGGAHPNCNTVGDKHLWSECMMNEDMEKRISPEEYNKLPAKFITEFGYPGPCVRESIERYLGGEELDRESTLWSHHNNTFERSTVEAGIAKHYTQATHLSIDDYLLYASLCQGMILNYAIGSMLVNDNCSGSLYWMFNDCWGETGWTTIDYYLGRKPSYYFVKRAFSMTQFLMRARDNMIYVTGINDTNKSLSVEIEYGYVSFDGKVSSINRRRDKLPKHFRGIVFTFPTEGYDTFNGCYFVKATSRGTRIDAAILRTTEHRNLHVPKAKLMIIEFTQDDGNASFIVTTDAYAHAVHFKLPSSVELSDNYFDLLPVEKKRVTAKNFPADLHINSNYCRSL